MTVWKCRLVGHQWTFWAEDQQMHWQCERGCPGTARSKTYPSAQDASRYAQVLNKRDVANIGERAPLLGMFPLRLWRKWTHR